MAEIPRGRKHHMKIKKFKGLRIFRKKSGTTIINDMIDYWRGKPNNPLNGKTFAEIEWLGRKYGIDLKGLETTKK